MRKKRVIKSRPPLDSRTALKNKFMWNGEARKADKIICQADKEIEQRVKLPFMEVFGKALDNIKPPIEMRSRRVGASKQRIPKEIDDKRSLKIALRWIVEAVRQNKSPIPTYKKLAEEIINASNKTGEAFKKKETLFKEAESGRVFSFNR